MRLVFFGTPEFAVPTLERLLDSRHAVVCVVCQPDRPRGRGRRASPAPVAQLALRAGLPLLRPERVADAEVELRAHAPDLGVVVAFGQYLPRRIRETPSIGYLINGHASLLPRYRGAAPVVRAILDGEERTGVSVMRVERKMDAGPLATARQTAIGPDESAGDLEARLARLAADAIAEVVDRIAEHRVEWTPQDERSATSAPKIERREAEIDWREPAKALARRVRAMSPSPGAFTQWSGAPLRILAARFETGPAERPPGTVCNEPGAPLRIATGDGWLVPLRVQRAGGKPLDVQAFLRGRPIPDGAQLGATARLDGRGGEPRGSS